MRRSSRSNAILLPGHPDEVSEYPAIAAPAQCPSEESLSKDPWASSLFSLLRVGEGEGAGGAGESLEISPAKNLLPLTAPAARPWRPSQAAQDCGAAVEPSFPPLRVARTEPLLPPANYVPVPGAAIPLPLTAKQLRLTAPPRRPRSEAPAPDLGARNPPVEDRNPAKPVPFSSTLVCAPAGALLWHGASLWWEWQDFVVRRELQMLQLAEQSRQSGQALAPAKMAAIGAVEAPAVSDLWSPARPRGTPRESTAPSVALGPHVPPGAAAPSSVAFPLSRMAACWTGEASPADGEAPPCPALSGEESFVLDPARTSLLALTPPKPSAALAPSPGKTRPGLARPNTVSFPVVYPLAGGMFRLETALPPHTNLYSSWMEQMSQTPPVTPHAWRTPRAFPSIPKPRSPLATARTADAPRPSLEQSRQCQLTSWTGRLGPAEVTWIALALVSLLTAWLWNPRYSAWLRSPTAVTERAKVETAVQSAGFSPAAPPPAGAPAVAPAAAPTAAPGFRERIANRSVIELKETFRSGLGAWTGSGSWAKSWRFDRDGVLRPGQLAIFAPSIPMEDYQLQLVAAPEHRSLTWVVRASDLRNYIGMRLQSGGRGTGQGSTLERWTVKEGRVSRRHTVALNVPLVPEQSVRVRMEVRGNLFRTWVEDRVVDVFLEETHPAGGVGLLASPGDQPRIYRLEVTHQQDFFGKLCSLFATHPITKSGTPGS